MNHFQHITAALWRMFVRFLVSHLICIGRRLFDDKWERWLIRKMLNMVNFSMKSDISRSPKEFLANFWCTSGQIEQHDVAFGMNAYCAEHVSDGHGMRGHLTPSVVGSHVQIAHLSNPWGGKYGYHDEPTEWNWSPKRHPRGTIVVLSPATNLSSEAAKRINFRLK